MRRRGIGIRLFGPFALLAVLMVGALAASLYAGAREIDAVRKYRDESLAANGLLGRIQEFEASVTAQTMWDDAVTNLDRKFSRKWADANIGLFLNQTTGFEITYVLDKDGAPLYGMERGVRTAPADFGPFLRVVTPLVASVRRDEAARGPFLQKKPSSSLLSMPIQASAVDITSKGLFIFTATLVQPDFGRALPLGDRSPILITGEAVDAAFVRKLADRFLLKRAILDLGVPVKDDRTARLFLKDGDGRILGAIRWAPETPGVDLLKQSTVPIGLVIVLLGGFCLWLIMRGGRAARALVDSEARLGLALGAARAGAFEIDFKRRSFWGSPELEGLVGRRLEFDDVEAWPWSVVHIEDCPRAAGEADGRSQGPFEARILMPGGETPWRRFYFEAVRDDDGRPNYGIGLVLDIDAQKRQELALIEAERAAQAGAEAKSRFLASVSHEIRTPMNGVVGVLHLLKTERISKAGRQLLDEALACGQMLASLVDDVLDFSRIEADRLELSPAPTDPVQVLDGVIHLLRSQAQAKDVTLTARVTPGVGPVLADPIRLRQCLFNLVGNAVKFTAEGSVSVSVARIDIGDGEGPRLRFEIADTGVGIPEAAQGLLFQRFQQADSSTTRRYGGTGLGLAITKRLAELMGGAVGLTSREGVGSTFWLEIAAPDAVLDAPRPQADAAGLEDVEILVIEDNATNRLIATKILEGFGARVETAANGELGVAAALAGRFDLILMDIQMPDIDGLEATRRIRAAGGPASQTPIIALTANVMDTQRATYVAAGMNGVAAKPISPSALVAEIVRCANALEAEAAQPEALAG